VEEEKELQKKLLLKLHQFSYQMEQMHLPEYVAYLQSPARMLWINFLVGIARGVGIGIGATVIAALILYFLSKLVTVPLIGKFVAEIIRIVHIYLHQ